MLLVAAAAHQADAPDLAGELPEPAAHLDVVLIQQPAARGGVFEALGEADGVELRQAILGSDDELETEAFQPVAQEFVVAPVPRETRLPDGSSNRVTRATDPTTD